jgi:hypothetical protein
MPPGPRSVSLGSRSTPPPSSEGGREVAHSRSSSIYYHVQPPLIDLPPSLIVDGGGRSPTYSRHRHSGLDPLPPLIVDGGGRRPTYSHALPVATRHHSGFDPPPLATRRSRRCSGSRCRRSGLTRRSRLRYRIWVPRDRRQCRFGSEPHAAAAASDPSPVRRWPSSLPPNAEACSLPA